jgi:hypothetical protein
MTGSSSELASSLLGSAVPTSRDDSAVIILPGADRAT